MSAPLNLGPVLGYLDDLDQHNNRVWFDKNRPAYLSSRDTFEQFISIILDEFRLTDHLEGLSPKDCIARIYRDIRFSKDKSPYKTNMGAMIAPGGWRSDDLGYFISIAPHAESMVAGGLYDPTPKELERFRQTIMKDSTKFKRITHTQAFIEAFGSIEGGRLKTAPKGYDRNHPDIELLRLKQITAVHHFTDHAVLSDDFSKQVVRLCQVMKPFLDYLTRFLG